MHHRRRPARPYFRSRHPLRMKYSAKPANSTKSEITLADRVEEVRLLCRELSTAVSNVEKWMNAGYNVSRAFQDKKTRSEIINAISALETQDKLEELKEVPEVQVKSDEQQSVDYEELIQALKKLLNTIVSGK